jgi:hypothetical protein
VLEYVAELARQDDYARGSALIDAGYGLAEAKLVRGGLSGGLGYEVLGGDGRYAFQTPFATLHAFNGWADRFLTTPVNGLRDAYATFGAPLGKAKLAIAYHGYDADHGSAHYGTELDASVSYAFAKHYTVLAKVADYHADRFSRDERKAWLSFEAKF